MEGRVEIVRSGITFGTALAMAISFNVNNSVLWAAIHGALSWIYVIYFVIRYRLAG
jgi:ABC-type Fe3+-siderophore transport system permease subunit